MPFRLSGLPQQSASLTSTDPVLRGRPEPPHAPGPLIVPPLGLRAPLHACPTSHALQVRSGTEK